MSEIAKSWHGSKNVMDVTYDAEAQRLVVSFKGGDYEFLEFPPEAHMAFDTAESPGKHFAAHIKGKYPSVKLEKAA